VQRIDFETALPVILKTYPHRQGEQVGKVSPPVLRRAAEPGAQKLERAPGPLELVRMRVAPDHDRGALGEAPVALP